MMIEKIDITNTENIKMLRTQIQKIYNVSEEEAGLITTEYIQYTAYFQTTFLALLDNISSLNLNITLKNTLILTYIHHCIIFIKKSKEFKSNQHLETAINTFIKEGIKDGNTDT